MPIQPTFPTLTEDQLTDIFGDDPYGWRRYRILHNLLVMGMTQREAARSAGVSERTVRNILRSYASGGLDVLRSRAPRRRRDRRTSANVEALATALAEEPQAGGDRLWRRAQELLGEAGGGLSRRTAYRILADIRAESEEDPPDSLRGAVRAGLALLAEDPPLALGSSQLAQRMLPAEDDPLLRGTVLQQALRAALDHLRPAGEVSTIDRSWWPYLICTGEYETGQRRAELQSSLALSASTYSRAKRQGLNRIAGLLPSLIERMIASPVALSRQRLPRTPDFIGRRDEQSYYAWRLQTEGLAHIWGPPGSGKTALAAELAAEGQRYGQTILWHSCRAGFDSTLNGVLRGLAQALASAGDNTLWYAIRHSASAASMDVLLEQLCERLRARPAVVVLDDFHHVDARDTSALLETLLNLTTSGSTRLLLIGRGQLATINYRPLLGLREPEARLLWAGAPALPPEQWSALYAATAGLPEPLRRVAAAYRRAGERARPGDWLQEVADWSHNAIWSRLSAPEQRLLSAAQALERCPWAEHAQLICEAIAVPGDTLERLQSRGLLTIAGGRVTPLAALRPHATERLREDDELRQQMDALAPMLAIEQPARLDTPVISDILEQQDEKLGAVPFGLELIARLRSALRNSAAYLQEQASDQAARQLAVELELLQGALPNLAGEHAAAQEAVTMPSAVRVRENRPSTPTEQP